jgi:amino acid transporter
MAQSKMLPGRFSKLHPEYKTPYLAILFLGILSMTAPLFGRVMLVWIVDAANFACCLAYFMVAISFLRLRKTKPNLPRPYRVSNGRTIGTLAAIMAGFMALMYILPTTSCALVWQEWIIVGGWAIIGVLLAISAKKVYGDKFCSGMEID